MQTALLLYFFNTVWYIATVLWIQTAKFIKKIRNSVFFEELQPIMFGPEFVWFMSFLVLTGYIPV